jgi:hypothetical protein
MAAPLLTKVEMLRPKDEENSKATKPVEGYAGLAAFIKRDPDHTSAIFARFEELGVRNLLYLQSELAELRAKQEKYDQEDFIGDVEAKARARRYSKLMSDPERKKLVLDIRSKLKEYSKSLMCTGGGDAFIDGH